MNRFKFPIILAIGIVLGAGGMFLRGCRGPSPAPAEAIVLPAELHVESGDILPITAVADTTEIDWDCCPPDGKIVPFGKAIIFASKNKGTYTIKARVASGGKVACAICKVTVGQPGPGPQPPGPGPSPTDPFWPVLKTAYEQETDREKVQLLAGVYREGVKVTADTKIATVKQLTAVLHSAAQSLLGDGLAKTRRALADEINAKLPATDVTPLDDDSRKKYAALYERLAGLLERL